MASAPSCGLADDVEPLLREEGREGVSGQGMVVHDEDALGHGSLIGRPRTADKWSVEHGRSQTYRSWLLGEILLDLSARVGNCAVLDERLAEVRVRAARREARVRHRRRRRRDLRLRPHERSLPRRGTHARPSARCRLLEHRARHGRVRPRPRLRRRVARRVGRLAARRRAAARRRSHRDRALRRRQDGGATPFTRLGRRRGDRAPRRLGGRGEHASTWNGLDARAVEGTTCGSPRRSS